MSEAPEAVYRERLAARRTRAEAATRRDRTLARVRLAVFALLVALAFAAFGWRSLPAWLLGPPALLFAALLVAHDRVIRARERAERAVAFYERGLARLEHRFAGTGVAGERFLDLEHPYAGDLDLFGAGGLFELLCTARTRAGEERLAGWLLAPAAPEEVRERQQAVRELSPALDLREDLALLGDDLAQGLHPEVLERFAAAPAAHFPGWLPIGLAGVAALTVGTLGLWVFGLAGALPFLMALALAAGVALPFRARVARIVSAVELPARELSLLSGLLARLEAERFEAPRLVALRAALDTEGVAPSRRIAQLRGAVERLDWRRNQLFLPIASLLLWTTQHALAIERWRATCGPALGRWIAAVAEFEALASLASHAFEQPGHPFAELERGGPRFEAEGLGHPLLPPGRCVRNDVRFGSEPRVFVVSGSNMSGKSTLLRSVGVNAVLAFAGGPVCARRLRLSPLRVGASIQLRDSLQEGRSRFYAEIRRLHQIMQLAEQEPPALFLLDEILHGTNSHDRGIGAEAVVRGLLTRGAIGLVTTHDLALARVAEALAPQAANVHFEDHVADGEIAFDYRLRPGVVERSNALELMRAVGLEV